MTTVWNLLNETNLQCPDGNATIYGKTGPSTSPNSALISVCLKCGDKEMGCANSGYTGGENYTYNNIKDAKYYNFPSTVKGYGKLVRFMDAGRADDTIVAGGLLLGDALNILHCDNGVNGFYVERFQNPADSTNIDLANFKPLCYNPPVTNPISNSGSGSISENPISNSGSGSISENSGSGSISENSGSNSGSTSGSISENPISNSGSTSGSISENPISNSGSTSGNSGLNENINQNEDSKVPIDSPNVIDNNNSETEDVSISLFNNTTLLFFIIILILTITLSYAIKNKYYSI
jgi:hypothetical protein